MSELKATVAEHARGHPFGERDFNKDPFIVFWELTRACALVCRHCRAKAQPARHPEELTTSEGFDLIEQVAALNKPFLVITGGDPLMRPDLFELIGYGTEKGLRVSLAPTATKLVTPESLRRAQEAGVARASFSLDSCKAKAHDAFRGRRGSFQRTIAGIGYAREVGLPFQINTTVSRYNVDDLESLGQKVEDLGAVMWDLFFLVPTGRGQQNDMISPQRHEEVFNWLYDYSRQASFGVKTTAAQHYRRVVLQRMQAKPQAQLEMMSPGPHYRDGIERASRGVNDGNGCCFISHLGEVYPSGFLPIVAGNVRERTLADIYRCSSVFQDLRDPSKLKGKCGRCEYHSVCGGSRARAYGVTGDYLAAEPYCVYQPASEEEAR